MLLATSRLSSVLMHLVLCDDDTNYSLPLIFPSISDLIPLWLDLLCTECVRVIGPTFDIKPNLGVVPLLTAHNYKHDVVPNMSRNVI